MQKGSDGMMDHCLPQTHVHGDDHHLHNRHDNDNGDYYGYIGPELDQAWKETTSSFSCGG